MHTHRLIKLIHPHRLANTFFSVPTIQINPLELFTPTSYPTTHSHTTLSFHFLQQPKHENDTHIVVFLVLVYCFIYQTIEFVLSLNKMWSERYFSVCANDDLFRWGKYCQQVFFLILWFNSGNGGELVQMENDLLILMVTSL